MRLENQLPILLMALLSFCPGVVLATAGFAEWEVRTPGGLLISDTDSQSPEETPCLRAPGPGEPRVLVRRLERWRYHANHVAGESKRGYFVVDERTAKIVTFGTETEFRSALGTLGKAESPWMSPADGWREAWFPFTVWRPCRLRSAGAEEAAALGFTDEEAAVLTGTSSALPSEEDCRASMAPEWFELYRRTTWGDQCRQLAAASRFDSPEHAWLKTFCSDLLDGQP